MSHDPGSGDAVLQGAGGADGLPALRLGHRHLVGGLHLCRAAGQTHPLPGSEPHSAGEAAKKRFAFAWKIIIMMMINVFLTVSFPQLDLITDLLGTPPLPALSSACEGARAHILMGPHKPVSSGHRCTLPFSFQYRVMSLLSHTIFDAKTSKPVQFDWFTDFCCRR